MRLSAVLLILTAFTPVLSIPPRDISSASHRIKARQLEEEIAQAAEEGIEVFEYPRMHDTSEQIHEKAGNVTAAEVIEAIRDKEARKNRLSTQVQYVVGGQREGYGTAEEQPPVGFATPEGYASEGR